MADVLRVPAGHRGTLTLTNAPADWCDAPVRWSSSDSRVLRVISGTAGAVTLQGVSPGKAKLTMRRGGVDVVTLVEVHPAQAKGRR